MVVLKMEIKYNVQIASIIVYCRALIATGGKSIAVGNATEHRNKRNKTKRKI